MAAQFDTYLRMLPNATRRTRFYWGHDGASFAEQIENCGLPPHKRLPKLSIPHQPLHSTTFRRGIRCRRLLCQAISHRRRHHPRCLHASSSTTLNLPLKRQRNIRQQKRRRQPPQSTKTNPSTLSNSPRHGTHTPKRTLTTLSW